MYYDKQIRYIDYLENGEKQRNCGYVKMTVTGNQLLLEMQIRGLYETDDVVSEVALEGAGAERCIGAVQIRQGSGSFRWEIKDPENEGEALVIGKGMCYGQLERVQVQLSSRRSLRCVWREASRVMELKQAGEVAKQGREAAKQAQEPVEPLKEAVKRSTDEIPGSGILGTGERGPEQSTAKSRQHNTEESGTDGRACAVEKVAEWSEGEERQDRQETAGALVAAENDAVRRTEGMREPREAGLGETRPQSEGGDERATGSKSSNQNQSGPERETESKSSNQNQSGDERETGSKSSNQNQSGDERETGSKSNNQNQGGDERETGSKSSNQNQSGPRGKKEAEIGAAPEEAGPRRGAAPAEPGKRVGESAAGQESNRAPLPPRMDSMSEDKWQQLWKIYPHTRPFQDEREYLSLRPEDFVILHSGSYRLAQNSFLLHGYFNYEHLILTQVPQRNGKQYYIGVPGNFYEKEKQVAVMYGFGSFECKREPAGEGDFGYYMIKVEL